MLTEIIHKIVRMAMRIFCIFPIKKNRIIFNSQKGCQYACNPRYIYEYLVDIHGDKLQYVWCLQNPPEHLQARPNVKIVAYNSLQYFYYQMTSKIIVANIPSPCYLPRRKEQFMIDTWHGGGAYKKCGISVPERKSLLKSSYRGLKTMDAINNKRWEVYKAYYNALDTNMFISSSKKFTEVMYDSQMLPKEAYYGIGMPRNDIFFSDYTQIKEKVKRRLCIDKDKKVILFAPTYRGDVKHQQYEMSIDIKRCLDAAKARWGGDWVFVFRMHIHSNSLDKDKVPQNAISASKYDEMQELLCMADVFITDYSSAQWDFALTKKPAFLFTPDLDYYLNEDRGFYTSIDDWAFPYARTNDDLEKLITNFDSNKHQEKVQKHLDVLGSFEQGNATERICEIIMMQMGLK